MAPKNGKLSPLSVLQTDCPLSVALIGDDRQRREGLRGILAAGGVGAPFSVATIDEVPAGNGHTQVDVLILVADIEDVAGKGKLPVPAGALASTPRILVSGEASRRVQRTAMDDGIAALVMQDDAEQALIPTIHAVCVGQVVVPRALRWQFETPALSQREKQVLGLVVLGYTNGEIARKLYLAESTVKSHLSSSFGKLGVRSRREATDIIVDSRNGLGTGVLAITEGAVA